MFVHEEGNKRANNVALDFLCGLYFVWFFSLKKCLAMCFPLLATPIQSEACHSGEECHFKAA